MFDINEINELIRPTGSFSYSAVETYRSDMFSFRTGPYVSVLSIFGTSAFDEKASILLKGKIEVTSDHECWELLIKFRMVHLSSLVGDFIKQYGDETFKQGQDDIRLKFRNLML